MQLNQRTDYALRLMMFLALREEPTPIPEVALEYGISEHHLAKVAKRLRELGYLATVRGRSGGYLLALPPERVKVGEVVRHMEDLNFVECFDRATNSCRMTGACRLNGVLREARDRFLEVLDRTTLADLVGARPIALAALASAVPD